MQGVQRGSPPAGKCAVLCCSSGELLEAPEGGGGEVEFSLCSFMNSSWARSGEESSEGASPATPAQS